MKKKFFRTKNNLIFTILKILNEYKFYLISFGIIFLIGFITGIMTCVKYLDVVTYENLINKYLINFLIKDSTYLSFFLMMSLYFILISFFAIFFTKNYFILVVDYILIAVMAYIYGFDICIITMTLGFAGVVFGVLVLGLLGVLVFCDLILIMSMTAKKFIKFRNVCGNDKSYIRLLMVLIILGIIILLIMSLLFGIIHIFVIVD